MPFVTVFWMGNPKAAEARKWAAVAVAVGIRTAITSVASKKSYCRNSTKVFSALIEDLANRNLLAQTLLLVTSEMGRKPKIGDPLIRWRRGGRSRPLDPLPHRRAGWRGIRGGQTYGSSDRYEEFPANNPVTPADIAKTVYQAMGIHDWGAPPEAESSI